MVLRIYSSKQDYKLQKKTARFKGRLFVSALVLPLLIGIGYRYIRSFDEPQAVLVLGGSTKHLERERFTVEFARQHPDLPIWVSGGSPNKRYIVRFFAKEGISPSRLYLDNRAVDTVTNFTTLADDLKARGINSVYLITSDYHMRRASIIGEIVLGSRGIVLKPVSVPSEKPPEPVEKSVRDGARAILWVVTGRTGSTLSRFFQNH
ncbi:MAG TPA: hypothetical protein DCY88_34255 [Cyanobacteria bacterium UBA11372]|nr:hypothetical protein [Cyanobacteria bacterium UBA11372]